jgi:hypothetical protein
VVGLVTDAFNFHIHDFCTVGREPAVSGMQGVVGCHIATAAMMSRASAANIHA